MFHGPMSYHRLGLIHRERFRPYFRSSSDRIHRVAMRLAGTVPRTPPQFLGLWIHHVDSAEVHSWVKLIACALAILIQTDSSS